MTFTDQLQSAPSIRGEEDAEWIHLLVGDWQLIADLSFADLVLWVPEEVDGEASFRIIAHCRPTTGATVFHRDQVGERAEPLVHDLLARAYAEGRIVATHEDECDLAEVEAVPVKRDGRTIALLTRHTQSVRRGGVSRLERNYRLCGSTLLAMIAEGSFPGTEAPSAARRGEPRVGDGLVVLAREGRVRYVSPNGISVLHRLGHEGDIEGLYLAEIVSGLIKQQRPVDEALPLVLTGRAAWRTEVEAGRVAVSLRSVPLSRGGVRTGALVLLRDVSEIRRRERDLLSRDAMIREVHHRVKNNLQTVSALLRLQQRRTESPHAKESLSEAMRRVEMISIVHDVLSQGIETEVNFDEIVDKGLRLTPELASPNIRVDVSRRGSFGPISSADSTALALALTELVTNAVEHGFGGFDEDEEVEGSVTVTPRRYDDRLEVIVADTGVGISGERGPGSGLGTQIVRTLITTNLEGNIEWRPRPGGGTEAVIDVPLREGE
ncbi:sensor histidine kinase [Brevibacterium sp. HMSC22B09]|uniref:sensor histidine kinase n=1 Tax=Brevibacterium sp. HMSC22B09 TaxID=1581055 RepID=UPI0008A2C296|nr:PAS domain-containing sensor histidine kinase [Brevibacterium sp. HMSC22B09]OFT95565.1 ATPase [Brevibacterium sp. HMSC22B09]